MKLLLAGFCCMASFSILAQRPSSQLAAEERQLDSRNVMLPNGWQLTPAGRSLELGDLPLNIAVSASGRYLAVTNNGQGKQTIQLIDRRAEKTLDIMEIDRSFYGLQFSRDEKNVYASGGHGNLIAQFSIEQGKLRLKDSIVLGKKWPEKIAPVGMAIDDARHRMYVVTKDDNALYVIDLSGKRILQRIGMGHEGYTCVLSPDGSLLYISLWGGRQVAVFDTRTNTIVKNIPVGVNPNELVLTRNGKYLFVANASNNSVSVINTAGYKVIETLNAALYPDAPMGSTTNGLSLSANEKTLYVANADNNCLAVFDITLPGSSRSKGFIPVGWYPTSVRVVGKRIFVANGKGFTSFANPLGPQPVNKKVISETHKGEPVSDEQMQYIGNLMKGTLSIIDEPTEAVLSMYSHKVYANTPYKKEKELQADGEKGNPVPMRVGDTSPIKYVFYILKENRTYDQVLGDMTEGNGDSSLCLFGEKYTPNQHKLAREYVLLDNFYLDAEVSADGHNWSMGALANDYLEKTWPTSYGRRGGSTEGMGRREIANNKDGFIWDFCKRAGVSYRTYGVFQDTEKGNIPSLVGKECSSFTTFYKADVRDTTRFGQWKQDFDSLVAIDALPRFNSVRFGMDHTQGMAVGKPTPYSCVADNDLAVGLFVEHLSNSPIWKECAVFIVEDDAQNGPDHVDAHRSPAFVISPYTRRKVVDKTMYSTSGMLRTMELILGLPPMTQYDAAATSMWRSFTATPDFTAFKAVPCNIDLNEKNSANTEMARISATLDFSEVDRIDDRLFNEILWKGLKGEWAEVPVPSRSAFVKVTAADDDDD